MERILITGANGNLGGSLTKELADYTPYSVVAVAGTKEKVIRMMEREQIRHQDKVIPMTQDEFLFGQLDSRDIYAAVHLAFARVNKPYQAIASSLNYTMNAYRQLKEMQIPRVIYISSQSIYGNDHGLCSEECPPAPGLVYSMAKFAGEKLLESEFDGIPWIKYTSLRLDYVLQSHKLIPTLCRDAKEKGVLTLKGGNQTFSYIDRTDVAKAIIALLNYDGPWRSIYNVGADRMRYTLMEVADIVISVARKFGIQDVKINLERSDTAISSGMDCTHFIADTGWKPTRDIYQMVEMIYEEI